MNPKELLIAALQTEIDEADFSTEQRQDDSYQYVINQIIDIFKEHSDEIALHTIIKIVNILDDLDVTLKEAYQNAIEFIEKEL